MSIYGENKPFVNANNLYASLFFIKFHCSLNKYWNRNWQLPNIRMFGASNRTTAMIITFNCGVIHPKYIYVKIR